jgi:hypothetical protein
MTSYELWLFLHVSATVVWLGGAVMGQVFGILTQRAKNPVESAAYGRNMAWSATRGVPPSSRRRDLTGAALTEDRRSEPFVLAGLRRIAVAVPRSHPRMGAVRADRSRG